MMVVFSRENNNVIAKFGGNDLSCIKNSAFFKLKIKRYVSHLSDDEIVFNEMLTYLDIKKILSIFQIEKDKGKIDFYIEPSLTEYLENKEFYIQSKYKFGNDIKKNDEKLLVQFEEYRNTLNGLMARHLREKQLWDSFFMCSMAKSANFSVPGSGKTASVLGVYAYLKHKNIVNKILMIGPKNAFGSWIDEFRFCFNSIEPLMYFNIHDSKYVGKREKINKIRYDSGNINLFLFNYESLFGYEEVLGDLINDKCLLVFDEVHKVKNITGEYARHTLEIAKTSKYTIAMTGTPIPNSYTDIYNLLHILYDEEYDEFFGFTPQMLKRPNETDMQLINDRLQPFFCRTTKNELSVPEANPDKLYKLDASPEENKLFWILYKRYKGNKFRMFIRMLQMESNPQMLLEVLDFSKFRYVLDDSAEDVHDIDFVDYSDEVTKIINSVGRTTKMSKCVEIVENIHSQGKVSIIWCIFVRSMYDIQEELAKIGINSMIISGEVELEERQKILDDFKKGNFDVLITNPHTLAESVSLHNICHDAIYFEYSYNLVHLLQSKDRIHRLGLPEGQYTQYYYLMDNFDLDGGYYSLDEQIYDRLKEKEDIMLQAIDNHVLEQVTSTEEDLELIFGKIF